MPDAGDFVLLLVAGRVCCLLPFFIVASSHAALFEEFSTWSISLGDLWSTMWHRHQDDLKKGSVCHHTLWGKSRQREMTAENTTIFQRLLSVIAATAMTWTRNTKIMEMWCLLSYFSSTNIFFDKIFFCFVQPVTVMFYRLDSCKEKCQIKKKFPVDFVPNNYWSINKVEGYSKYHIYKTLP